MGDTRFEALWDDGLDDVQAAFAVVISEIFVAFILIYGLVVPVEPRFDLPLGGGITFTAVVRETAGHHVSSRIPHAFRLRWRRYVLCLGIIVAPPVAG